VSSPSSKSKIVQRRGHAQGHDWRALKTFLAYPFRSAVLVWLLGLALAAVPIQAMVRVLGVKWLPRLQFDTSPDLVVFGMIGIALELFWWLVAFKIAVEALNAAANGRSDESLEEGWNEDANAARQMLLWAGVLLVGYGLYVEQGSTMLALYGLLLAIVLPAVIVLLRMVGSLLRALDPRRWRALARACGRARR
jgi:hypothetical protein